MASQNQARQRVLEALSDVVTVTDDVPPQRSAASYYPAGASPAAPMAPRDPFSQPGAADSFDPLGGVGAPLPTNPGRSKSSASLPKLPDESSDAVAPPPLPAKGMGARFAQAFRRQNATDKEAKRREKEKRMHDKIRDSQAKSSRMDIIDRLDLSGIAGSSLFHHDSPYDACSPHANRNHRQAPVRAFDPNVDPMTGLPINRATKPNASNGKDSRQALSPLAAATMRKMNDSASEVAAEDDKSGGGASRSTAGPAVPALGFDGSRGTYEASAESVDDAASTATHSDVDRDVDAERAYRNKSYYSNNSGRRDASAPNADIWGVSSEPWQDFAQPAPKRSGQSSLSPNDARRGKSGDLSEPTSCASSVYDMEAVMTGRYTKHLDGGGAGASGSGTSAVSPGGGADPFPEADWGNRPAGGSNGPKRSKSLLKRIKSARQNPNVPVSDDLVEMGNMNLGGGGDERPSGVRKASYTHKYSPSTPPMQAGMGGVNSLAPEGGNSGLGRSGTLRSRPAPGSSPSYAAGGQQDYMTAGSAEMRQGRSRDGTSPGGGGAGVGRSNSIFGRFGGRGKGREVVASR